MNEYSVLAFLNPFSDKSQRREEILSSSPKYLHTRNPRRIVSEAREVENPKGEPSLSQLGWKAGNNWRAWKIRACSFRIHKQDVYVGGVLRALLYFRMTAERFRRGTGKGNRRCSVYHRPRTSTAIPIHFACPSLPSCCLDGLDGAHPSGYWQKVFFISDFFARAVLSVLRQPLYQRPLLPSFLCHSPLCILFSESCHRCQNIDNGSYLGEMDE